MKKFIITRNTVAIESLKALGQYHGIGARSSFEGIVRDTNDGHKVRKLEYECYESLAVKEGDNILDEAIKKFGLINACCIHRVGSLEIGDTAVIVLATSGHRDESFKGCRYIIDQVKQRVPIWKKEYYLDGESEWLKSAG
tara:strand:+ start:2616 stop:3035 length:420 start_codon:yes stop_codon:yes gene_type:complete